jgi:hypothetical protein
MGLYGVLFGLSMCMGPVIGSFIFNLVGFSYTFITFGCLMAPSCILVITIGKPAEIAAAYAAAMTNEKAAEKDAKEDQTDEIL